MYGFGGVGLSEVQNSISELSVVGGGWWWVGGWVGGGGLDKRTSWSDLHRVRQKEKLGKQHLSEVKKTVFFWSNQNSFAMTGVYESHDQQNGALTVKDRLS